MSDQDKATQDSMITLLRACGFDMHNIKHGQHQIKGTIENATAFFKLITAGADATLGTSAATDHVLALSAREKLRRAHDALASMSDTDLDHFDNEEDEIEAVPDQYAARMIYAAIDDLNALLAYSILSAPRAKNEGVA